MTIRREERRRRRRGCKRGCSMGSGRQPRGRGEDGWQGVARPRPGARRAARGDAGSWTTVLHGTLGCRRASAAAYGAAGCHGLGAVLSHEERLRWAAPRGSRHGHWIDMLSSKANAALFSLIFLDLTAFLYFKGLDTEAGSSRLIMETMNHENNGCLGCGETEII